MVHWVWIIVTIVLTAIVTLAGVALFWVWLWDKPLDSSTRKSFIRWLWDGIFPRR